MELRCRRSRREAQVKSLCPDARTGRTLRLDAIKVLGGAADLTSLSPRLRGATLLFSVMPAGGDQPAPEFKNFFRTFPNKRPVTRLSKC